MPETSIIIRAFNEEKHIGGLLKAIRSQDYRDYEIILVDSGSTDGTLEIAQKFCDRILSIESQDFTFGYSLNMGFRHAQGKYVVLVSAHTLPTNSQWLTNLIEPFKEKKVAMVYGKQVGNKDTRLSEERDFEKLFGESLFKLDASSCYANNANSAVRKEVWQKHYFNEYLFGLEDVEWAKFATENGFGVVYNPKAAIHHIHDETWSQVFNRYRREAIAARQIGLKYPPQANPRPWWLVKNMAQDFISGLPNISLSMLKDIIHFRYTQWKGTRKGWYYDRHIDLNQEKEALYYPSANQAVVITGQGKTALREVPFPKIRPSDILVKIAYSGVCRTDLEVLDGKLGYYQKGIARYPIVPGHEFSGVVAKVGANNIIGWKVGERVVGECILSCGKCSFCQKGLSTACPERSEVGVMNRDGAYAKFISLPAQYLHKVPESVDLKTACLTEPLAVVLRALRRAEARIKPEDECAVIGAGSIGNFCVQTLLGKGHQVTVFDKNEERLKFLEKKTETSRAIKDLSRFDLIIEATGNADVLSQILKESRTDATLLILGFPYGSISYNFENLVGQEKVIIGSVGGAHQDFKRALELLPQLDTEPFTQKIVPLEDFSKAWQLHRSLKHLKVILKA